MEDNPRSSSGSVLRRLFVSSKFSGTFGIRVLRKRALAAQEGLRGPGENLRCTYRSQCNATPSISDAFVDLKGKKAINSCVYRHIRRRPYAVPLENFQAAANLKDDLVSVCQPALDAVLFNATFGRGIPRRGKGSRFSRRGPCDHSAGPR
jgi:hypothetical protein